MSHHTRKNAVIESTMLGLEGHGILSSMLGLNYGGTSQGFGGYAFDQYDKATSERTGTAYGMEFIRRTLDVVGVEKWEALKGKHIRVRADHGKVHAIGHIIEDKWFTPEKDLAHFFPDER